MLKKAIIMLAAAIVLPASGALGQSTSDGLKQSLRELMAKEAVPAGKGAGSILRSASVRVSGVINKQASVTLPLRCFVFLSYRDGARIFTEQKDQEVVFNADVGTCNVRVPFRWKIEDETRSVLVDVTVSNQDIELSVVSKAPATPIYRTSEVPLESVPLPGEGQTAVVRFDIDM